MKWFKRLGNVLAGISVMFVIYRLCQMDFDWNSLGNPAKTNASLFFLSFFVLFNNAINAYAWKRYIDFFSDKKNDTFVLIGVYLKANIEKYLPGNVVQYAGRNILAKKTGVGQKSIAAASVMELLWIAVCAVLFSLAVSTHNVRRVVLQLCPDAAVKRSVMLMLGLGGIALCGGFFILKKTGYGQSVCSFLNRKFLALISGTALIYMINFTVSGVLLSLIFTWILHCETDFRNVASTNVLAWLAGYVVPGSPGGIGIREAVFIGMSDLEYAGESVVLSAVLLRICGIAGDVLSYIVVCGIDVFRDKRKRNHVS